MIPLDDFASLLGYSSWYDLSMYKNHGAFIREFQEGNWIPKDLAEIYIAKKGIGDLLNPKLESIKKLEFCCSTGKSSFCLRASKRSKIIEIVRRISVITDPVPEVMIWHDLFLQTENCQLKDYAEYQFFLFELAQEGIISRIKSSDGCILFEISKTPKKRGPGRPRKF